jgi:uncharacterized protein YkwD
VTAVLVVTATTSAWQLSDGTSRTSSQNTGDVGIARWAVGAQRLTLSGTSVDWASPDLELAIPSVASLARGGAGDGATTTTAAGESAGNARPTDPAVTATSSVQDPGTAAGALAAGTASDTTLPTLPSSPPAGGITGTGTAAASVSLGGAISGATTVTTAPAGGSGSGGARTVEDELLAPAGSSAAGSSGTAASIATAEARLLELLNEARITAGLAPLSIDPSLQQAAHQWAQHLAGLGQLAHQELAPFVPPFRAIAENLVMAATAEEGHAMMAGSAGHMANVTNPAYTVVGIGVAVLGDGSVVVSQLYAG